MPDDQPTALEHAGGDERADNLLDDDVDFHDTGLYSRPQIGSRITVEPPVGADEDNAITAPTPRVQLFNDLIEARESGYLAQLRLPGLATDDEPEEYAPPRGRPPLLVWVCTGLFTALMVMTTFLYPALSGPGEPQHVDMTYSYYNGNGYYAPGERHVAIGVQRAGGTVTAPSVTPLTDQVVARRGERSSFAALGGDPAGTGREPNPQAQQPPLYYGLGAGVLHLVPGSPHLSYDRWVAILRYVSVLLLAPLPLLAWAATRVLAGDGPAAVTAAAVPLTVPGLVRLGGSWANVDGLILLGAVLTWLLARVLAGDRRLRTGIGVGVTTGLAALTAGPGLLFVVVVAVAYTVALLRQERRGDRWARWRPLATSFGAATLLTTAIGGWWWVRTLVLHHAVAPNGYGRPGSAGYVAAYRTDHPDAGFTIARFVPAFLRPVLWRVWGGLGSPENPRLYPLLSWVWLVVVAVGVLAAVAFGVRGRGGRATAAVFVLPALLLLAVPMARGVGHYLLNGQLPGAQGFVVYPGLVAVALLVGVGLARLVGGRAARWLPLAVVAGGLLTQVLAWRLLVLTWWVPRSASGVGNQVHRSWQGILRWSPWAHPVTIGAFAGPVALAVLAVLTAARYGWRRPPAPEPTR